jgi:hypothetical protein
MEVKAAGKTYHIHVLIIIKSGSLNHLEPSWPVRACNGIALSLPLKWCGHVADHYIITDVMRQCIEFPLLRAGWECANFSVTS